MSQNEDKFRQILDRVSDGIYEVDFRAGRFLMVNDAMCRMLGYSRAEFLNLDPDDILDADGRKLMGRRKRQWLAGKAPEPVVHYRMAARDGRQLDMQLDVSFTRDADGKPAGAIVIARDVTGLRRAEAELQAANEARQAAFAKTQVILDSIDEGFCIIEVLFNDNGEAVDYRFLETNRAFARQTGIENAIGKRMRELAPEHEEHWFRIYGEVARTGESIRFEAPADALGAFYDVFAFRFGDPACNWVGILFEDVSERKRIEHDLASSHAAMDRRTQELNAVIRSVPDGMAIFNRKGDLTFLNAEARRFYESFEVPLQSSMGEPLRNARVYTIDGRPLIWEERPLFRSLEHGETVLNFTMMSNGGNGETLYSAISTAPITDADGAVTGAVALLRDITTEVLHEQWLRASESRALTLVNRLQESDRNKNRFLGILSHELRNPLAAIVMGLALLDVAKDEKQYQRAKDVLKRQATQLTRLVDDLLDITRISENRIRLKKERIDLVQLMQKALTDFRVLYAERSRDLTVDMPKEPLPIHADAARITQAVGNLLYNALKFTHEHDHVRVQVHKDAERQEAVIRVEDTGVGIDPVLLPHLFSPFTQADTSLDRSQGGLGLGLSIVKGMVELHGGQVNAASDGPGKGAQFTIRLPLMAENVAGDRSVADMPAASGASSRAVLIIEDNQDLAEVLSQLIRMMGHTTRIAHSGESGLHMAFQSRPDIIICDIGLPDMDGYEVARRIRSHVGTSGVRLYAMSGYGLPEDVERAKTAGFDRHLTKPVNPDAIRQALDEAGGE